MRGSNSAILLSGLFCWTVSSGQVQDADDETRAVERFHAGLVTMMQAADHSARAAIIAPLVRELFAVERIASVSVGRHWRTMDEMAQGEFKARLTELIVATYADRFDNYNGQSFVHLDTQQVRDRAVVRTRLKTNRTEVQLDYFFRAGRIFNVAADGVSDLSLRRADYTSILKTEGLPALLDHMQRKIQEARGQ